MQDDDLDDALDPAVQQALAAWSALPPPADFANRVLAAREATPQAPRPRRLTGIATIGVAAAAALIALWPTSRAASGALTASRRTTERLGDRGLVVAEPASELVWRVDEGGAAEVVQRTGNVFYRVERGGAFVVHTPAGDVRVTGTCFRIEVTDMKTNLKLGLAGLAGAALASTVLITVYEGRVIAETHAARTELSAGTRATLGGPDGSTLVSDAVSSVTSSSLALDDAQATREQLIVRARLQAAELTQLRARLARLEGTAPAGPGGGAGDAGRPWRDPSPEQLAAWVADCHIRADEPSLEHFEPLEDGDTRVEPGEHEGYNAAMTEMATQWKALVRRLYIETTGDSVGAESLSTEAMRREVEDKSPPDEQSLVIQRIARERAGLAAPPVDVDKTSAVERMMRAYLALGDQAEAAIARRLGAARARALRGDGWGSRMELSGCPKTGQ